MLIVKFVNTECICGGIFVVKNKQKIDGKVKKARKIK